MIGFQSQERVTRRETVQQSDDSGLRPVNALTLNSPAALATWNAGFNPAVCYEVIRIRQREGFQIGGRFVEPAEVYPNSEAWGVDGWTMQGKEAAFRKLREVVVERARTFRGKRSGAEAE